MFVFGDCYVFGDRVRATGFYQSWLPWLIVALKTCWNGCKCNVRKTGVWHASRRCHVQLYLETGCNSQEPYLHLKIIVQQTYMCLANGSYKILVVGHLHVNRTDVFLGSVFAALVNRLAKLDVTNEECLETIIYLSYLIP